jgi:hypothetical protein
MRSRHQAGLVRHHSVIRRWGYKTVGFGAVVPEKTSARIVAMTKLAEAPVVSGERFGLAVTFDRPIVVDSDRVVDNAFVGSPIIPGGVFKGALARKLALAKGDDALGVDALALAGLHISQAWPEDKTGQPSGEALPLSSVAARPAMAPADDTAPRSGPMKGVLLADALRLPDTGDAIPAEAILGPKIGTAAALFIPDWKGAWADAMRARLGQPEWAEPATLPRTHTAIGDEGTVASGQLFTTVARSVRHPDDPKRRRRFLLMVDLAGIPETEKERGRRLVALRDLNDVALSGVPARVARVGYGETHSVQFVLGRPAASSRQEAVMTEPISKCPGKPIDAARLVEVPHLVTAYFTGDRTLRSRRSLWSSVPQGIKDRRAMRVSTKSSICSSRVCPPTVRIGPPP